MTAARRVRAAVVVKCIVEWCFEESVGDGLVLESKTACCLIHREREREREKADRFIPEVSISISLCALC